MISRISFALHRLNGLFPSRIVLALLPVLAAVSLSAAAPAGTAAPAERQPFLPGEKFTYNVSWSNILSAGTAVMEVKAEKDKDGRDQLRFISTAATIGMLDQFYTVRDTVQSLYDPRTQLSSSYTLDQRHGKRKRKRSLLFDRDAKKATYIQDGVTEVVDIKDHVQDALSSLYFLRTVETFTEGGTILIPINDSGKNWDVEVQVLAREKIKTKVGEFPTIKLKTYPKYEGVFMHKGEIFIWLTDDRWRVPVLMKSTIAIGSIVADLTELRRGEASP
jgi:hypothetical protein